MNAACGELGLVLVGGATAFQELAAEGSWQVEVLAAGHMDFVDWNNAGPERALQFSHMTWRSICSFATGSFGGFTIEHIQLQGNVAH